MKRSTWFSPETDHMLPCPCCGKCDMSSELLEILDQIRNSLGRPVIITSGYRCSKHNATLDNSVSDSAHTSGLAVDISCRSSRDKYEILQEAMIRGSVTRVGIGRSFIHIDVDSSKPQRLVWTY